MLFDFAHGLCAEIEGAVPSFARFEIVRPRVAARLQPRFALVSSADQRRNKLFRRWAWLGQPIKRPGNDAAQKKIAELK